MKVYRMGGRDSPLWLNGMGCYLVSGAGCHCEQFIIINISFCLLFQSLIHHGGNSALIQEIYHKLKKEIPDSKINVNMRGSINLNCFYKR